MNDFIAVATAQDDQHQIVECIARAKQAAGDDAGEFIRLLNECYVSSQALNAFRVRGLTAPSAGAAPDRTPKSRLIAEDPRYRSNALELARRTQGGLRVIGGMPVPKGQFLDCVAVGNDQQWGCTGTLVAPDVVITAGHCLPFATRVFFGGDVNRPGKIVAVKDRVRHPEYRQIAAHKNDLMVLLLAERIENIEPRRLADADLVDAATDGRVVGFGNTDPRGRDGYGVKRQVDVPIASTACHGRSHGNPDPMTYGCHADLEIVAGKPLLAKDSCTGDSGGPFYMAGESGDWVLAGATSRPTHAAANDCGDGGIYVRIDRYRDWLRSVPGVTLP
jgi:secreted trypsin-like serine protease